MFGGNPQRDGWARDETVLTKNNVKSMKLVWKLRLESAPKELTGLTAPIIVENVLTAEGHKDFVVVAGASDLAEIARICALESGVEIVAMVDAKASSATFVGVPVVASFAAVEGAFDAVIVTDLGAPQATFEAAAAILGPDRVLAPKLLGVRARPRQEAIA